jgi:multidrug efflux pump subunit AcrA (membrane-fusion protein)
MTGTCRRPTFEKKSKRMNKNSRFPTLTAISTGLLTCIGALQAAPTQPAVPAAVVFGKAASQEEISDELSYPARVIPKVNTTVLAESDGVISELPTLLGQPVRTRQTLMVISHTDPVYKYAPMKVLSPITGVISAIEVAQGTQVIKGQKLASVTDPKRLRVVIEVPAEDLDSLKKGDKGDFRTSGRAEPISVKLEGTSPFVDPATGTATCEFQVDSKQSLAPGIVGRVSMKVHQRKGIRIPEYAIIYRNQEPFARIYENGKIRFTAVKLGKKQEGRVEILSGIKENEVVIERSSRFVSEGETVQLDQGKSS